MSGRAGALAGAARPASGAALGAAIAYSGPVASLELRLLGGFEARAAGGEPLAIAAKKARALLAFLALPPGRAHSRERLAELIWGDVSRDEHARRSLRQALTTLRRSLPDGVLEVGRDALALASAASVDVVRFERLARASDRGSLAAAVELYRGELLEGFSARADAFDSWVGEQRRRLRELALGALERLCALQESAGELEPALATAMRLVALDPLREAAHRRLMGLYAQSGRTSEALRQLATLATLLRDELGVQPDRETLALAERLRAGVGPEPGATPEGGAEPEGSARPGAALERQAPPAPELRAVCALCAVLDPRLPAEADERARAVLEGYGGSVVRASEDRVLAVFGLERATGVEAERAVRAALALGEVFGRGSVCAGIASGQVLREASSSRLLRGDVLRQAIELAEGAGAGVVVARPLARALGPRLELSSPGLSPSPAPGRPGAGEARGGERVLAWRGVAESSRGAPFVGRTHELAQLAAVLDVALRTGRGRAFIVRGEAGIGKTRLVSELRERALGAGLRVHARPVVDFGAGAAQRPVAALVRELLGSEGDVTAALAAAVSARSVPSDDVPLLLDALELLPPMVRERDPASREEHLRRRREAVARLLEVSCRRTPRLVWIDDVHWADAPTLAQLAALVPIAGRAALVLVLTTRLEGAAESAELRAALRGSPVTTLDLAPLEPDEAERLARDVAGEAPAAQRQSALRRAGGNPLFLEQLLRAGELAALPDSVQSVVQARVDGLGPQLRAVLGAAAVLGQRFTLEPLAQLLGSAEVALAPLVEQALVALDDGGHRFVHGLVREAVYASLTPERRAELHRRAAAFFAGSDRVLCAEHLERAADPEAPAALAAAALDEQRKGNLERADELCARGLALALLASDRFALALARGEILCDLGRYEAASGLFDEALTAASDAPERARAWVGSAAALRLRDRASEALAALSQAERCVDPRRDSGLVSRIHYLRGSVLFPLGDPGASLRSHHLALEAARGAGAPLAEARALSGIADAHFIAGRFSSARAGFSQCQASARAAGGLELELSSLGMLAVIDLYGSRPRAAAVASAELADRHRAHGLARGEALMRDAAAWGALLLGEWRQALDHAERAVHLASRIGAQRFEALGLSYAVIARCELGPDPGAAADAQRALELARASGVAFAGGAAYAALVRAETDRERTLRWLEEAERTLESTGLSLAVASFAPHGITAALRLGEPERARRYARLLEASCELEPHDFGVLITSLGRGLADWKEGVRAPELRRELAELRRRLLAAELNAAVRQLDEHASGAL